MDFLKKTTSRLAIAAAAGAMATSAFAADLGGNCCTDLEERVAELEATTARKGNRKVSLTIYGALSPTFMFWDDGSERNVYIAENDQTKHILGFQGSAKITGDWSAGYRLEFEVKKSNSADLDQKVNGDNSGIGGTAENNAPLSLRHAALYVKSEHWGTVWLGQSSTATSSITNINLANAIGAGDGDVSLWANSFFLRRSGTVGDAGLSGLRWVNAAPKWGASWTLTSLSRRNVVRYITPNFLGLTKSSGFNIQTSWGEDDVWDIALRYAEELGQFRVAAGIGYSWSSDNDQRCANPQGNPLTQSANDCHSVGGSASVMHTPTGIYVSGGYAEVNDDRRRILFQGNRVDDTDTAWWVQAGIEQKWHSLGKTTLFFNYYQGEQGAGIQNNGRVLLVGAADVLNSFGADSVITGSRIDSWGVGVTQNIEAAAMDLYLGYQNYSADVTLANIGTLERRKSNPIDDFGVFYMGARIQF